MRNWLPQTLLSVTSMLLLRVKWWLSVGTLFLIASAETREVKAQTVRFATFNIWELSREKLDRFDAVSGQGTDPQLLAAATILQRVRPDVLLVNEIDFDEARENARLFAERYLAFGQRGQEPLTYAEVWFDSVNTGVPSGLDLNRDGQSNGPDDAWGYGRYPGQYGMALFSRLPIERESVRTFQKFLWRDMPDHQMPDGIAGRPAWYSAEIAGQLRLSSKSHWDVPLRIDGRTVHVLASHPTPPVYDGPEDRNGRRNHDEIRLWSDYISGGAIADYLIDDAGRRGGLPADQPFVVLGDLNADPDRGERLDGVAPIRRLLDHPRVQDPRPTSRGGLAAKRNLPGDQAARATANFGRLDYALPSQDLRVVASGVFWPAADEPLADLVGLDRRSSDHRLVWVDIAFD